MGAGWGARWRPDGVADGGQMGPDGVLDRAKWSARREPCHQPFHF
jgi:hypothetical protein